MGDTGCRSLRLRLVVEFANGTTPPLTVVTSTIPNAWWATNGPRTYDHEYHGEIYDTALETPGWDTRPFSTNGPAQPPAPGWHAPVVTIPRGVDDSVLEPMRLPPLRRTQRFYPVDAWPVRMSDHEYTFNCPAPLVGGMAVEGQNAPGAPPSTLTLACAPGTGTISKILFANYGIPSLDPTCTQYNRTTGTCPGSNRSLSVVEAACLNKTSCAILVNNNVFGGDPCPDMLKRLAVVATGCEPLHPGSGKPSGERVHV